MAVLREGDRIHNYLLEARVGAGRQERHYVRAERDGQLVGWAVGGLDVFASVRTAGFADVVVHPAHRRAGIGAALWGAFRYRKVGQGTVAWVAPGADAAA